MGRPTIIEGNAPGLERIPIYNIENFSYDAKQMTDMLTTDNIII